MGDLEARTAFAGKHNTLFVPHGLLASGTNDGHGVRRGTMGETKMFRDERKSMPPRDLSVLPLAKLHSWRRIGLTLHVEA